MKRNCPRRIPWSELPPELLLAIAERLESRADILHFRRVCKTWRASSPLSLLASKNILSPLFPHCLSDEVVNSYTKFVVANSVFLVRSVVNPKLLNPGKLWVRVALYRSFATDLPGNLPFELDISRFRVLELGRFYTFRLGGDSSDDDANLSSYEKQIFPSDNKVLLFVDPKCKTCPSTIDDCTVVKLSNDVPLYVKRLPNGLEHQVSFRGRKLDDIIEFKGEIYAVDRKGRLCSMDYNSLKMSSITDDVLCEGLMSESKKRLAVSNGELYLVYSASRRISVSFNIFKLNEDRILFVTFDGCFFASTKDFPQ